MYRDRLTQNRSRELVAAFLDDFLAQRGWWAARAAWVDERGMVIDPWRVSPAAPSALDPLRRHTDPVDPVDPGAERYPEPVIVPVSDVRCTRALVDDFSAAGVDELIVVDVAGVDPFDLRLAFAVDAAQRRSPDGIEALRTGAALLPTLIRQEGERDALRLGALRDALTGLLNRPGLDELAAQRPSGSFLRAVIYLDLDGFKAVNDAHGHGAGDEVLVGTAQRLVAQVRPHDLVARLGGDEFVIVAEQVLDESSVVSLSQRIIGAVSHDLVLESGAVVAVAASAGVALWPEGEPLEAIIATADGLMYEAKRIGGGIAMQDGAGRILVRDPLDGRAVPEEVERGRAPVRALPLDPLGDAGEGGAHVVLRGELCTVAADEAAETVLDALRSIGRARPTALVLEPRGRGWARDGVLADLVAAIRERRPASRLTLLVDAQPSAIELRLAAEELRALGQVSVALGGVGAVHGGDLRMIAQVSPTLISLDHEAVLNLTRTSPAGLVARLAAALAQTVDAPLLVVEPPDDISDDTLRAWGASAVARTPAGA
ncbi:MAG: diguanylate cyclase domain-containing protein [Microcella sp.]